MSKGLGKKAPMTRHPVIGLNMSMDVLEKYERVGLLVPISYADAVAKAGGLPLCLPLYADMSMVKQILPLLDGVVFIGGDDYWPEHFGGHPQPEDELMPERRDRFDWAFARLILQKTTLPVLGICGGHQLMAIAQGGALVQDIRTEWSQFAEHRPLTHAMRERTGVQKRNFRHAVHLDPDSLIARVMHIPPEMPLKTNSFHHQAVHPGRRGRYLRATAWSGDGVIEALEPVKGSPWARAGRFVLGVQWHPERLQDEEPQQNIFRAFVAAAQKTKS